MQARGKLRTNREVCWTMCLCFWSPLLGKKLLLQENQGELSKWWGNLIFVDSSSCIALSGVYVRKHMRVPVCTCPWVTWVLHNPALRNIISIVRSNNFQMTFRQIPPPAAHHRFFNELFSLVCVQGQSLKSIDSWWQQRFSLNPY